jgi:hypothetical protein
LTRGAAEREPHFRGCRGQDSTGVQQQAWCSFDPFPDPAGAIAAGMTFGYEWTERDPQDGDPRLLQPPRSATALSRRVNPTETAAHASQRRREHPHGESAHVVSDPTWQLPEPAAHKRVCRERRSLSGDSPPVGKQMPAAISLFRPNESDRAVSLDVSRLLPRYGKLDVQVRIEYP